MLNVVFSGLPYPTIEQEENETKYLENYLGDFLQEFIDNDGVLQVHNNIPFGQAGRYTYGMKNIDSFFKRFQDYRRSLEGENNNQ